MGKLKNILWGGLKGAGKGIWTGAKYGAKYGAQYGPLAASILAGLGTGGAAPLLVIQALKGGMAIAEAKGGRNKASIAIAIAIQTLKDVGVEVPAIEYLKMAMEALHDPNMNEGDFAFDLEAAAKTDGRVVTMEDQQAIQAELARIQASLDMDPDRMPQANRPPRPEIR